jgi:hypothetical protein
MKNSFAIACFLVIAAAASGVSAIVSPYLGSDTLYNVITQSISGAGLTPVNAYIGTGTSNGQAAMVGSASPFPAANAKQQTNPATAMITNGGNVCKFNSGTNGSADTSASGIVIGLDALDILSSTLAGGQSTAACNGTADNTGSGLAYSGTTGVFAGSTATQNWRWVLALVYGGRDLSTNAAADCGSTARRNLVANWSKLFQGGCANTASQCNAAPINGVLWHAYRRDDAASTSSVFANLLGLTPNPSNSTNNGFGSSPFCNAINWDTSSANSNCALGGHNQWTGPGGVNDPASTTTPLHRRPPPGTWGDNPDSTQTTNSADVLPTQFQDNDPIRRPCLGGATNVHARPGEEVCNLDGALGLVLPLPSSSWLPALPTPLKQYPTNACNTFAFGKPVNVFTCAPLNRKHFGECPNGDSLIAGGCLVPVDQTNGTSQCVATKATIAALQSRSLGNPDGRAYNLHMRDGTITEPNIGYAQYPVPALGNTLDFVGGYNRIHQVETVYGNQGTAAACQLVDPDDQIGCLLQADACSIGFAGDTAKTFASRTNPAPGSATPGGVDALRISQVYPTAATIQGLGAAGEYPAARKLYFESLVGFANIAATAGDVAAPDELNLAKFLANPMDINPILLANGFFTLGAQSPAGVDTPFCEDFNEQVVCNPTPTAASTLPANVNACAGNPAGIPTANTVCGNGVREAYEECDDGLSNGTTGDKCTQTCRCANDFQNGSCI